MEIITGLLMLGKTWLENKRLKTEAIATAERKVIEQAGSWEEIHAKNSGQSWKDEYWTIVFSIPLIMCFIPRCEPYVAAGFSALDGSPEWYRYSLGVLVAASVGIRQFDRFKAGKK